MSVPVPGCPWLWAALCRQTLVPPATAGALPVRHVDREVTSPIRDQDETASSVHQLTAQPYISQAGERGRELVLRGPMKV